MKEGINSHKVEQGGQALENFRDRTKPQDRPVCADSLNSVEAARIRRHMRRISRDGR